MHEKIIEMTGWAPVMIANMKLPERLQLQRQLLEEGRESACLMVDAIVKQSGSQILSSIITVYEWEQYKKLSGHDEPLQIYELNNWLKAILK